ncbi:MAG: aldehyde ferredoxin oxidoreductase family protein [Bacillota bacterium]|jgi:aldehyde:ferredoxin oxidoreductase|nr:aldehyde ferredoxin oxidoreductase family protein [Candidatus Fermentithermobacillaceae bacterium]
MNGYAGKILRVDLTRRSISVEEPPETFYRKYFGGTGFIAHYLLKEVPKGADPLGPLNKVIFALGPMTGHPLPGSGRNSVGAKSPLTGGIGFSEAGGFWGAELKRAGFDAIIVEGKSETPCYIYIKDGTAEIRDGSAIWGKTTGEVEAIIKKEIGDDRLRVAQCGIAGENKVRYACVLNDVSHAYGRGGIGAVMGSKNLRAIAVRGTKNISSSEPEKLRELARWFAEHKERWEGLKDTGTAGGVVSLNTQSALPTKNFQFGQFEGHGKISGQTLRDTILVDRDNCYACPIHCKRVVKTGPPYNVDPKYGGPEYETIGSLGSTCGVDDLEAICKGNELCNAYGLDTISAGVTIALAMECFEKGLLTLDQLDGIEARFGNAGAMLALLEKIARREGVGDLLAEGSLRAAKAIGKGAEELAIHVKGQEVPMHEPRLKMGLGVGYALSPTGADHCHNIHDTGFAKGSPAARAFGLLEPIPANDLGPDKVRLLVYLLSQRHFGNCVGLCSFVGWSDDQVVEMVRAATGWNSNLWELLKTGERAMTLARLFNIREGFTDEDDVLPKRFYEPFLTGPLEGVAPTPDQVEKAKRDYYEMMGWDRETGIPGRAKAVELDIEWAREAALGDK